MTTQHSAGMEAASPSAVKRSSFYMALRILPAAQRQAMYAVYGFCRAVDDIADEGGPRPQRIADLERWQRDIEDCFAGRGVSAGMRDLVEPIAQFGLRQADFAAVVDGMMMDAVADIRAPDWSTLDLYCDRVASAVGRLSVRIFGVPELHGEPLAYHLGRALQLTNILRDIDEDAAMGRLYLPREELEAAGITIGEPMATVAHANIAVSCLPVVARARRHFDEAWRVIGVCPRASTRSPRLMAAVYGGILDNLVMAGFASPRHRVRTSKLRVLGALLRHGLI